MDCVSAGQMYNTTGTLARLTTRQPKGTNDAQYRYRVCVPADVPSDDCDPAGDAVKENAMAPVHGGEALTVAPISF